MRKHAGPVADDDTGSTIALRRALLIVGVGVSIGLLPFLSGLVGALILATVTRALHDRLRRIVPTRVSAFTIAFAILGILVTLGTWLASTLVDEAGTAVRSWRPDAIISWLSRTPVGEIDLAKEIASLGSATVAWISDRATAFVGGATLAILNVVVAMFGLYYLLIDGPSLWARVRRLLPLSTRVSDLLANRFGEVTEALLLGTALTAALQGLLVGFAFAALGVEPAVLWGFVTACAAMLPVLGSALVWGPAAVVLLFGQRPLAALILAGFGLIVVSNIDNLVRLAVYRRVSGIHPMLTLVGAFAGVRLFGIIGAFVGPLILSYFVELIGVYDDASRIAGAVPPQPSISVSP